jgi:hypothetical protein
MKAKNDLSVIEVKIPKKYHKQLKEMAKIEGKSIRAVVLESIEDRLCCGNYPNKETIKAIKSIESGKGLVEAKNAEDLFNKLGI